MNLVSGRAARRVCVPSHCEVLRLEGKGPIPSTKYLNLIEVGRAVLKPGDAVRAVRPARAADRDGRARRPLPHAAAVAGRDRERRRRALARRRSSRRSTAPTRWFLPIEGGDVHPWAVGAFAARVQRLTAQIEAQLGRLPGDGADRRARRPRRRRRAPRRGACCCSAAKAARCCSRSRSSPPPRCGATSTDARRRLTWFGARRWQVELFTLAESTALAALGTLVGWVARRRGRRRRRRRAPARRQARSSRTRCSPAAGPRRARRRARRRPAALSRPCARPAVQVGRLALHAARRGGARRGRDRARRLGARLGRRAAARVERRDERVPAARAGADRVRGCGRRGAPARAGAARARPRRPPRADRAPACRRVARAQPGHAAIAATFLVASLGLALFAVAYRSTLIRGQHDEAAYAVPAPYVLERGSLAARAGAARPCAYPGRPQVLRLSGNVPSGTTFTFLGLPARRSTPSAAGARTSHRARSRRSARRSRRHRDMSLRTVALPPGRRFTLAGLDASGDDVGVRAFFRSPLGDYESVPLGHTDGAAHRRAARPDPVRARDARAARARPHRTAAATPRTPAPASSRARRACSRFGTPRVDGRPVTRAFARGPARAASAARRRSSATCSRPTARAGFRPRQPTDGSVLRVLATPQVAAAAGPERDHPAAGRGRAGRGAHRRRRSSASRRSSATR